MKRDKLEALVEILRTQLDAGSDSVITGTWTIRYDETKDAFTFDKCQNDGYCEERPSIVGVDGTVLDKGGPLFE